VKIVLAPDKLKGTLTVFDFVAALARGFEGSGAELVSKPMADGGEGTLDVLAGRPVAEPFFLAGRRATIESARVIGLQLVPEAKRDALRASSRALGELLLRVLERGVEEVWIALGGSATTDGGAGFASALGARFLDAAGRELEDGGGALERLERVVPPSRPLPKIVALCDVKNPLLGPRGTAHVFAPQKGASAEQVQQLERGLARLAYRTEPSLAAKEGAGAAGGLGFGLAFFARAELVRGARFVAEAIGLDAALEGASLVVTGEGRLDRTTFEGKTVRHVLSRARELGVPAAIVAGSADPEVALRARELGVRRVVTLVELAGGDRERAEREAAALCERAARELVAELGRGA